MNQEHQATLFDRLGGAAGVRSLVDTFYACVFADPELAPFFESTPRDKLLQMQTEFFSAALEGPIEYRGRPLAHVHHGRGIERRHFARFLNCLLETLQDLDLEEADVLDMVERISTYVTDITGSPSATG